MQSGRWDMGLFEVMLWLPAAPLPGALSWVTDQTLGNREEQRRKALLRGWGNGTRIFSLRLLGMFLVFNNYMHSFYEGKENSILENHQGEGRHLLVAQLGVN